MVVDPLEPIRPKLDYFRPLLPSLIITISKKIVDFLISAQLVHIAQFHPKYTGNCAILTTNKNNYVKDRSATCQYPITSLFQFSLLHDMNK